MQYTIYTVERIVKEIDALRLGGFIAFHNKSSLINLLYSLVLANLNRCKHLESVQRATACIQREFATSCQWEFHWSNENPARRRILLHRDSSRDGPHLGDRDVRDDPESSNGSVELRIVTHNLKFTHDAFGTYHARIYSEWALDKVKLNQGASIIDFHVAVLFLG